MTMNLIQNTDGSASFKSSDNSKTPIVFDDQRGAYVPPEQFVQFADDFLGDLLEDGYSGAGGSDPQALTPAINAQNGGVVRLVAGDSNVSAAADASVLTHALNWKAGNGGLFMEARIKAVSSVADFALNVGFTDTLGTTTVEEPFTINGTTVSGVADDAACFVFDTAATNDTLHAQGAKGGTDTAISNTGEALTADAWIRLGVALDSSGTATFYVDGVQVATVANAVTTTVALTPVIAVGSRTTAAKTVDVDYLVVRALRA